MQYQNAKGIYVYFMQQNYENDSHSIDIKFCYYPTLEHFFWMYQEYTIKSEIGYSLYDKVCTEEIGYKYGRGYCGIRYINKSILCGVVNCVKHNNRGTRFKVVYDESGKQYLPDVLVGLRRAWLSSKASRDYHNRYSWHKTCKKKACGGFRKIHTFQETKWANAWNDEENAPKTRRARTYHNLPDSWCDQYAHSDKSWKTQSKRKKQWK